MGGVNSSLERCFRTGSCLPLPNDYWRDSVPSDLHQTGTKVIIRGLQSAPQHNGKEGVIISFEPYTSRYLVRLKADEGTLSVRAENVMQALGVEVVGLESRPELNGRIGRVVGSDRERYHVSVQGQVVSINTANVVLPTGAHARVVGLRSDQQWNGRVGAITSIDRDAKRYVVQMDSTHQIKVKWDNVLL